MEITLTPEQERIVQRGMATGRYATPEAFVEDALSAWSRQIAESNGPADTEDGSRRVYVQDLNQAVREAQDELRRGEYKDYGTEELDALFEEIRETGRQRLAAKGGMQP